MEKTKNLIGLTEAKQNMILDLRLLYKCPKLYYPSKDDTKIAEQIHIPEWYLVKAYGDSTRHNDDWFASDRRGAYDFLCGMSAALNTLHRDEQYCKDGQKFTMLNGSKLIVHREVTPDLHYAKADIITAYILGLHHQIFAEHGSKDTNSFIVTNNPLTAAVAALHDYPYLEMLDDGESTFIKGHRIIFGK